MTALRCLTRRLILIATLCTGITSAAEKKSPEDRECVVSNGTTNAEGGARAVRKPGEKITITAKPPGKDMRFDQWVGNIESLADAKAAETILTMPAAGYEFAHVHVSAAYRSTAPKPFVHPLFADRMVLQRDVPAPVWGWAQPGEKVTVEFAEQKKYATADASGKWIVKLDPMPASAELRTLTVNGTNQKSEIENHKCSDILVGDVWLCSGQSNMRGQGVAEADAASANYPQMRALMVNPSAESYNAAEPCETFEGYTAKWETTTPEAARHFSRVAFYFGEALQQHNNVPIGLIVSSFDGSSIEAWMPRETLASLPEYNVGGTFRPAWNLSWGGGQTPFVRYNAHIAPIAPFALRGVLWYQGESNANQLTSIRYRDLLALMIRDWRRLWSNDALPFIAIQLHSFGKLDTARPPGDRRETWIEMEESQLAVARKVPHVACAVTLDLAKEQSLHPPDKKSIGKRAALVARKVAYGENILAYGPLYEAMKVDGDKIRVTFVSLGGGLVAKGGESLKFFAIAGEDRKWAWADAKIEGDAVVVSSPKVKAPVAVRYAWGSGQQEANLFNNSGLPAPAFRTDDWTQEEKK